MIIDAHCHLFSKEIIHPQAPEKFRENIETRNPENLLELMNESDIDKAVLSGVDWSTYPIYKNYKETNNYVASTVKKHPDRFTGFLAVDPKREQTAIQEVERCIGLGLRGVKIFPHMYYVNDNKYYPLYEKIREHNLPILFHTGASESPSYLKYHKPILFDTLAVDFPEITIILAHLGKPWVDEAIRVARKNHNIYLDLSAWDDLYLSRPMYLVETIAKAKSICGMDKILFGTDWPVQLGGSTAYQGIPEHITFKEWVNVIKNLQTPDILKRLDYPEITEKDRKMILGENAAKILNL